MRHLSLFSGSGIGTLAAKEAGIVTVAHAENDPACCYCLERLWLGTKLFKDVRDVSAESLRRADVGQVDIISGGFPCQDLSTAGRGAGIEGSRSGLWREMFRIIRQVRPRWILVENVPAIKLRGIDRVLAPLARIGYSCWPCVVGAWAVGAPHKRDRVWIVGRRMEHAKGAGCVSYHNDIRPGRQGKASIDELRNGSRRLADTISNLRGRGSDEPERQPERRTAVGRTGEAMANAECPGLRTSRESERQPRDADACDEDMANAGSERRQEPGGEYTGTHAATETRSAFTRWPARPGEPQHEWEAPRLVEFSLGDATDGMAGQVRSRANKAALRMAGNGWCYPQAVILFRAIVELDEMLNGVTE